MPMLAGFLALPALALSSSAQAQCWGSLNSTTSVIGTVNTAFLSNGSAFVSTPDSAPSQQGGGVWVRTVTGSVDLQADSSFSGSFSATPLIPGIPSFVVPANESCRLKVHQDFTGVQAGHDIASLNTGNSGINWHFGVLAGYVAVTAKDVTPGNTDFSQTGNFEVPSLGVYSAFSKGAFFADAQARLDFFQGESLGERLDARGYAITANAGYRFDLGGNWSLEPSAGGVYSRTSVDLLNLFGTLQNLTASVPSTMQIDQVESLLGRASLKLGTSLALGSQIVVHPFFTASVFHEFADNVTATLQSSGTVAYQGIPVTYTGGGRFTVARTGTYEQFGGGSAFQFADTGWLGYIRADYRTGSDIQGYSVNGGLRYQLNPGMAGLKEGAGSKYSSGAGYNWTGPYAGISAGSLWGSTHWAQPGNMAEPDYAGYLAGGQFGYNYQFGHTVLGIEADAGVSNARGSISCPLDPNSYGCQDDVGALGSITARLGYAWGRALFYAKGGWAFGEVTTGMALNYGTPASGTALTSSTNWENGWTAGGGMEFALTDRWSAKAEYMHHEFGANAYTVAQGMTASTAASGDAVRVGVNYHFGR
jgi:opacity protein-like surface antigen